MCDIRTPFGLHQSGRGVLSLEGTQNFVMFVKTYPVPHQPAAIVGVVKAATKGRT